MRRDGLEGQLLGAAIGVARARTPVAVARLEVCEPGDRDRPSRRGRKAGNGRVVGSDRAELAIIGQPNMTTYTLENPIVVPGVLSFLCYGSFGATVEGLLDFPKDQWPDNVVLLQFIRGESRVRRGVAVMKTRASAHDPQIREFEITSDGFVVGDQFSPELDLT